MASNKSSAEAPAQSSKSSGAMCHTCGLPLLLCVCRSLDQQATVLRLRIETRRYGKAVTVVGPFASDDEAERFATALKKGLATGGTRKGLEVELQGDFIKRARQFLEKEGFTIET